jgi:hypothetical protein
MCVLFQVYDISPQQQQWLTSQSEQTLYVHNIQFTQTSGVIEKINLSKVLLVTEHGLAGKFTGRHLDEISFEGKVIIITCFFFFNSL